MQNVENIIMYIPYVQYIVNSNKKKLLIYIYVVSKQLTEFNIHSDKFCVYQK